MEMMASLFALLLFAGGCCGLRWREELREEGEPVTLCSGHSLRLFWNFTLDPGEYLKGIVWSCEPEREHEDIMATYMDGHFVPRAAFSGRLAHLQDGAIELSCTTILESGNYSIEVSTEDANSHLTVHRKTVAVTVFDKPKTQTGEFHVTRKEEAVRDVITGAWHVQLSCGNFSDLGHPPVDVIWTTPKGAQLTSTGFQHGMFYLMVPNPATGGTYTCTIPASQPAARCLDRDSPLRDTASVNLDEVMVKLLLLEARHQEFMDRTEARHREFENRTEALQQVFEDRLKAERDDWINVIGQVGNRTEAHHQEFEDSLKAAKNVWKDAIGQMGNRTEALEQWRDDAVRNSAPVSFHAMLTSHTELSGYGDILKLDNVISNQGGGYNSTTGYFTAPVSGTYFFIGTTAPYGSGKHAYMALMKEGSVLTRISLHRYHNYYSMGSCHAVVYLNAGQRVWLANTGTSYLRSYRTAFSGFKLL